MGMKDVSIGKPLELPKNSKKIPELNDYMLPSIISDYVFGLSKVIQQPLGFVATSSLISIAGLLGNKVALEVHPKRIVYPNLWGMLVGESGTGKTPSISETIKPIKEIDKRDFDNHREELKNHYLQLEFIQSDIDILKNEYKKSKDEDKKRDIKEKILEIESSKPIKPFSREIYFNKSTKEALVKQILEDSPNGLLVHIDELMDWLIPITKVEKAEEQGLFLSAYNSEPFKSKTVSRGTEYVDNITLSIIGGVQTQRLLELTQKYSGSGLLARFQLIPVAQRAGRSYSEAILDRDIDNSYKELLYRLKQIPERTNIVDNQKVVSEPLKFKYTDEAKKEYIEWHNQLQNDIQRRDQSDLMIEYLGKADNTFHALAVIFHLAENTDQEYISVQTVEQVIMLMLYFLDCAKYLYDDTYDLSINTAKEVLNRKSKFSNDNGFTISDIYRSSNKWRKIGKELISDSLKILDEHNYIYLTDKSTYMNKVYKWNI